MSKNLHQAELEITNEAYAMAETVPQSMIDIRKNWVNILTYFFHKYENKRLPSNFLKSIRGTTILILKEAGEIPTETEQC